MKKNLLPVVAKSFLGISLFVFLCGRLFASISSQPFHIDEHEWIRRSYLFDSFISANFSREIWSVRDAYDQPKLAEFIYGLSLHVSGVRNISEKLKTSNFNLSWDNTYSDIYDQDGQWWSVYAGKSLSNPPQNLKEAFNLVIIGRKTSAIFMSGAVILMFFVGQQLLGYKGGLICMALFGFHPLTRLLGRLALANSILIFFLIATVFSLIRYIKRFESKQSQKAHLHIGFIGLFTGLSASTKLNGFMILLSIVLVLHFIQVIKHHKFRLFLTTATIITLTSGFIFYVLNPFLYLNPFVKSNPIKNFQLMFSYRVEQNLRFKMALTDQALNSPRQAGGHLLQSFLGTNSDWSNIKIREISFDWLLVLFGVVFLIKTWLRSKIQSEEVLIVIWFASLLVAMSSYVPTTWTRYLFPLLPPLVLIETYGIVKAFDLVKARLTK